MDIFAELPYLARPDTWHPDAHGLIEEVLEAPIAIKDAKELWASLGALTQAKKDRRASAVSALVDLLTCEELEPAWPLAARCLVRLGSSPLPGCYFATLALHSLVTHARKLGRHQRHDFARALAVDFEGWDEPPRSKIRAAIDALMTLPAGPPSYAQALELDDLGDRVERAEECFPEPGRVVRTEEPAEPPRSPASLRAAAAAWRSTRPKGESYFRELSTHETTAFTAFINDLKRRLYGLNYRTLLQAKVYEIESTWFSIPELIEWAYPGTKPGEHPIGWLSPSELRASIEKDLCYEGDDSHGGARCSPIDLATYWSHVDRFVDIERSTVITYSGDLALPGYDTWWRFCYFVIDPLARRMCILYGVASD